MTEPLKFFKVDRTTIYHDGFLYSFHRILDPCKSSADLELRQSFHCILRKEDENCRSRCLVTGNWEMDKKGRKFMLGIVKKADHTHGQEYSDTTPKLKFYKHNDNESIHRNGFLYTFNRELDSPKQIADFQWNRTYRCALSDQKNCRAKIYTTGQWEMNKRKLEYQLGIFKNCIHSHESEQVDPNKEDNKHENNIVASQNLKIELVSAQIAVFENPYSNYRPWHASWRPASNHMLDKKEQIRFYKYKERSVQHNGFFYNFQTEIKVHPKWKQRMICNRYVNCKRTCNGYIWTTGKWDKDDRGREFQLGIVMGGHDHEPHHVNFQVMTEPSSSVSYKFREDDKSLLRYIKIHAHKPSF